MTYGTLPPTGYPSTSKWLHWLMLMLADRIDMIEGVGDDLVRGHVPNVFAEMGLAAEWRYNRPRLIRKLAAAGAVTALVIYGLQRLMRD